MKLVSAGNIFRELAKERQLTLKQLSTIAEAETTIDLEIDKRTEKLGKEDNTVVDAQLAAHFTPDNTNFESPEILKICITASPEVRWERIAIREKVSLGEAKGETIIREKAEEKRFQELYQIDINDLSVYDIVINTDHLGKDYVYNLVETIVSYAIQNS